MIPVVYALINTQQNIWKTARGFMLEQLLHVGCCLDLTYKPHRQFKAIASPVFLTVSSKHVNEPFTKQFHLFPSLIHHICWFIPPSVSLPYYASMLMLWMKTNSHHCINSFSNDHSFSLDKTFREHFLQCTVTGEVPNLPSHCQRPFNPLCLLGHLIATNCSKNWTLCPVVLIPDNSHYFVNLRSLAHTGIFLPTHDL